VELGTNAPLKDTSTLKMTDKWCKWSQE